MTESPQPDGTDPVTPSRRDRLRPLELIGFSVVLAVFAALVVLMVTRNWTLTGIAAGVAFIVSVMMVALVGLGKSPSEEDRKAREDLQGPDGTHYH